MKNLNNGTSEQIGDPAVSAAYEAGHVAATPGHLDKAILQEAAHEVADRSWLGLTNLWLRPVTYLATLGVCAVLLVNINQTPADLPLPPGTAPYSTESDGVTAIQDAANRTAQQIDEAAVAAGSRLQGMPEDGYGDPTNPVTSERQSTMSCSDAQRETPASWTACIDGLTTRGENAAAIAEKKLLRAAFPGFQIELKQ